MEIECDCWLLDELVIWLCEVGLLCVIMLCEVVVLELVFGWVLWCVEVVVCGDVLVGWCVLIVIISVLLVVYLLVCSCEEMFGGGWGVVVGVWVLCGMVWFVDGGVVVFGCWLFCSGINYVDIMFVGCFVDDW